MISKHTSEAAISWKTSDPAPNMEIPEGYLSRSIVDRDEIKSTGIAVNAAKPYRATIQPLAIKQRLVHALLFPLYSNHRCTKITKLWPMQAKVIMGTKSGKPFQKK